MVIITKLKVAPVELVVSSQSSSRVERVELCCSTSSTQPKCMGSTRRTCRVVSSLDEPSAIRAILRMRSKLCSLHNGKKRYFSPIYMA